MGTITFIYDYACDYDYDRPVSVRLSRASSIAIGVRVCGRRGIPVTQGESESVYH